MVGVRWKTYLNVSRNLILSCHASLDQLCGTVRLEGERDDNITYYCRFGGESQSPVGVVGAASAKTDQ